MNTTVADRGHHCRDLMPSNANSLRAEKSRGVRLRYENRSVSRTVSNGYFRGWGLQWGELSELIEAEPLFRAARQAAYHHDAVFSLLPDLRLKNIYWIISRGLDSLSGQDVAEFGVYRGGTSVFLAYLLRELSPQSTVFGFDTYEGAPQASADCDLHSIGDFADASLEAIERRMNELGLNNFTPVIGDFCAMGTASALDERKLALVHVDCDTHTAVKTAINRGWDHLCEGGYLLLDDADASSCLGATQAMEEFVIERQVFSEQAWPHFVFRKEGHVG